MKMALKNTKNLIYTHKITFWDTNIASVSYIHIILWNKNIYLTSINGIKMYYLFSSESCVTEEKYIAVV